MQKKTFSTILGRLLALSITSFAGSLHAAEVFGITPITGSFQVSSSASVGGSFTPEPNLLSDKVSAEGSMIGRVNVTVTGGPNSASVHSALRFVGGSDADCSKVISGEKSQKTVKVVLGAPGKIANCGPSTNGWLVGADTATSRTTQFTLSKGGRDYIYPDKYTVNFEAAVYVD